MEALLFGELGELFEQGLITFEVEVAAVNEHAVAFVCKAK